MRLTAFDISPQEKMTLLGRLFKNRTVDSHGCWLWTGCLNVYGYGVMGHKNRQVHTHRLGYFIFRGDIPDSATGLQLDHLCRVRSCFNPWHLEIVTIRANLYRSEKTAATKNARKTHCIRGHLLAGDNIRKPGVPESAPHPPYHWADPEGAEIRRNYSYGTGLVDYGGQSPPNYVVYHPEHGAVSYHAALKDAQKALGDYGLRLLQARATKK